MTTCGERIKLMRAEKKMTQKDLAAAMGISVPALQNYENDIRIPSLEKQIVISQFFNVSLEYLRGETDDRGDGFEIHAHRDPTVTGMDLDQALGLVTQLEKLSKLHDDGKLTDEEYSILKSKIIRG
ncbi:MAG: helix-turn-helix transcriptional regulator [Eubacteriales bacterium]